MIEMAQTELEQAVVKTIRAEQFVKRAMSNQLYTQENGEEVGNGDSKHHKARVTNAQTATATAMIR
jgi:hypothetical protein